MRRILPSLFLMALALGVVYGGGVLAAFTATDTETGGVQAGTAEIRLNSLHGVSEFVWNLTCDSSNMVPGDSCHIELTVHNDGTVWLTYVPSPIEGGPCFDVEVFGPFDIVDGGDSLTPGLLPPPGLGPGGSSEQETIEATATLVGGNECMGVTESAGVRVDAESIPTP